MVTKREYLIEKGLAGKRGRFSAKAKDAAANAINKGMKFDEPEDPRLANAGVGATAEPRYDRPNGMYTFRNPDGTTFQRLHTVACMTCAYSLQWCYCIEGPILQAHPWRGADQYARLWKGPAKAVITTNDVPEKQPQQGTRRGRGRPRKG